MPCASLDFLLLNIVLMKWSKKSCDFLTLGMLKNKAMTFNIYSIINYDIIY